MKFYSLGKDVSCYVLKLNGVTLMLDCGFDFESILSFLPSIYLEKNKNEEKKHKSEAQSTFIKKIGNELFIESKEMKLKLPNFDLIDLSRIDAILISNYQNMFALPYVTENSLFNGSIYATEPTIQIGRQLMEEFCILFQQQQQRLSNFTELNPSSWKNSSLLSHLPAEYQQHFSEIWKWVSLYDQPTLFRSISKIQTLSYQEKKSIYSLVTVTPVSSGFCLGSANWVIETSLEKITYIAESSTVCGRHPEGLQAHSLGNLEIPPSEIQNLKGKVKLNSNPADIMIVSSNCVNNTLHSNSESLVQDAIAHIGMTINNGNNVLIPCLPSGIIFDLFENIETLLIGARMKKVPIFFVSPVAEHSLAYANIIAEWLYKSKQEKAYIPEAPFLHEDMIASKHLYYFDDAHSLVNSPHYSEPCIVFIGHPSLRFGDVLYFLEMWGNNPNTLLYLDPDYKFDRAFAPFKFSKMNIAQCPIDWRLNQTEINRLIHEVQPAHLLLPANQSFGSFEIPVTLYQPIDAISIPLTRRYQKALISEDLAKQLKPQAQGDLLITDVSAILMCRDHKYFLDEAPLVDVNMLRLHHQRHMCGSPNASKVVLGLRRRGIDPSRIITKTGGAVLLEFDQLNSSIFLTPTESKINTHSDDVRSIFSQVILEQCSNIS